MAEVSRDEIRQALRSNVNRSGRGPRFDDVQTDSNVTQQLKTMANNKKSAQERHESEVGRSLSTLYVQLSVLSIALVHEMPCRMREAGHSCSDWPVDGVLSWKSQNV
jgi:hypothetical protein